MIDLRRLVVAVPRMSGLSPFRSETHFKLVGWLTRVEENVHLPGPMPAVIASVVAPLLRTNDMPLLSPLRTLELQVTPMVPDWRVPHEYVSSVTVSAIVGLILMVVEALPQVVGWLLKQMVNWKVKDVSAVTFGALKVACAATSLVIVIAGVTGDD